MRNRNKAFSLKAGRPQSTRTRALVNQFCESGKPVWFCVMHDIGSYPCVIATQPLFVFARLQVVRAAVPFLSFICRL